MSRELLLSVLFLWFLATSAPAQTGSWNPPGATASYPRTLLTSLAIPGSREFLAAPPNRPLYASLYNSIASGPASGNTTADERRSRATFVKNAAFVLLMDRKPTSSTLTTLPGPERALYQQQAVEALESLNPAVEPFASFSGTTYTEWQWRSKELIDYLIAYDLLRGAGVAEPVLLKSRTNLQQFAGNLYRESNRAFLGCISFARSRTTTP